MSREGMRWPLWEPAGFQASFTPTTIVAQLSLLQLVGHTIHSLRSVGGCRQHLRRGTV